jgi:general secretion pathway protein L
MLTGLITWWKEQMRDLVPASLRMSGQTWRRTLIVAAENTDVLPTEVMVRGRTGEIALGQPGDAGFREILARLPAARRMAVVLRVSPDLLLEREVVVPMAAERELQRVMAYEMDRLTPFRADEVFWTCIAEARDPARDRLHVRVTIVPRGRVQPALAALRQAGLNPTWIEAGDAAEPHRAIPRAIPLAESRPKRGWLGPHTNAYAMGGCGVLAAVAIALPFLLQSVTAAGIDTRIEAMRPQVALAEGLRKKIASRATTAEAITAARDQVGAPLQSIALLTDVLPDDTFLTSMSVRQHQLTISGRSAAAARLIGAIAAHPLVHNPAFAAPVIRDETNGGELFTIRTELGHTEVGS